MTKLVQVLMALAVALFIFSNLRADQVTSIYVSLRGNDAWSGSLPEPNRDSTDGPLRTLAAARDKVREQKMKWKGSVQEYSFRVVVRGGTYYLEKPLVFEAQDSRTSYSAFPGENPVISGGFLVEGFSPDSQGRWKTSLKRERIPADGITQLFVNGERRSRPRLPKSDYYRVAGFAGADPKANYRTSANKFEYSEGSFNPSWRNLQGVEVVIFHFWISPRVNIKSIDSEKRIVEFNGETDRKLTDDYSSKGARYFIENVFEAMSPGEWYYDKGSSELFYMPREGEEISQIQFVIPRLKNVIQFAGKPESPVRNIELRGVSFQHSTCPTITRASEDQAAASLTGAMLFTGSLDCSVRDCVFTKVGGYAIEVGVANTGTQIIGNEISDCGGGGIKVAGVGAQKPENQRAKSLIITDNHIHHIGNIHPAGVGILVQHASDCVIAHNEIDHTYYSGISVGWVWGPAPSVSRNNVVEYNHIHDIGQKKLSDMGGIYTLGTSTGTRVQYNLIHDVDGWGYGSWGIYLDEGSAEIAVENNLVYRCRSGAFFQHEGGENWIRNNILALAQDKLIGCVPPDDKFKTIEKGLKFERNILYWEEGEIIDSGWDNPKNFSDYNLYYKAGKSKEILFKKKTFDQWRSGGWDAHSKIADPLFKDVGKDDFTLGSESPAISLGFQPFDLSSVGTRADVKRKQP